MARKIVLDIDLSKINKSKIKNHQNGGKYYKLELVERKTDKSDWIAFEQQTKEERESRTKGNILGNGKNFGWESSGGSSGSSQQNSAPPISSNDLPF